MEPSDVMEDGRIRIGQSPRGAVLHKLDGSGVIARSPKVQFAPGAENILMVTVDDAPPAP